MVLAMSAPGYMAPPPANSSPPPSLMTSATSSGSASPPNGVPLSPNSEIARLKRRLAGATEVSVEKSAAVAALEAKNHDLEEQIASARKLASERAGELVTLEEKHAETVKELEALRQAAEGKSAVDPDIVNRLEALRKTSEEKSATIITLEQTVDQLQAQLNESEQKNDETLQSLEVMQSRLLRLQQNAVEVATIKEAIAAEERAKLEKELETQTNDSSRVVAEVMQQLRSTEHQLEQHAESLLVAVKAAEDAKLRIEELEHKVQELEDARLVVATAQADSLLQDAAAPTMEQRPAASSIEKFTATRSTRPASVTTSPVIVPIQPNARSDLTITALSSGHQPDGPSQELREIWAKKQIVIEAKKEQMRKDEEAKEKERELKAVNDLIGKLEILLSEEQAAVAAGSQTPSRNHSRNPSTDITLTLPRIGEVTSPMAAASSSSSSSPIVLPAAGDLSASLARLNLLADTVATNVRLKRNKTAPLDPSVTSALHKRSTSIGDMPPLPSPARSPQMIRTPSASNPSGSPMSSARHLRQQSFTATTTVAAAAGPQTSMARALVQSELTKRDEAIRVLSEENQMLLENQEQLRAIIAEAGLFSPSLATPAQTGVYIGNRPTATPTAGATPTSHRTLSFDDDDKHGAATVPPQTAIRVPHRSAVEEATGALLQSLQQTTRALQEEFKPLPGPSRQ